MAGGHDHPPRINNLKGIERQLYALKPARLCFKPQRLVEVRTFNPNPPARIASLQTEASITSWASVAIMFSCILLFFAHQDSHDYYQVRRCVLRGGDPERSGSFIGLCGCCIVVAAICQFLAYTQNQRDVMAEYVEQREGQYFLRGSRVSLDSIVYGFVDGESPETIQENFPTLTLEQIYGTITFYLAHRSAIEEYLKVKRFEYEEARASQPPISSHLRARLEEARANATAPQS